MQLRNTLVAALSAFAIAWSAPAQRLPRGVGARELDLYARLLAMTDTRQLDTALIERARANKWQPLRTAATIAIGQIGPERGMSGAPRLRALLNEHDVTVAANAAYALGLLRDSASVPNLAAALTLDREAAREAAWALGEIGAPAHATITAALKSQHDHDVTIQLLLAAAKMRPVPVVDVRSYLRSGHGSVVWAATYAISRTRAPAGVRDLIDLESSAALRARPLRREQAGPASAPYADSVSGNQRTRAEIARGLAKSAAGDSLGPTAFAVLSRLVGDVDPHVRVNAVRSLATYGPPAKAALMYATHDHDANVRIAAAQSFGTVLSKDASGFSSIWMADTSIVYRSSVLSSAARAGLRPPELQRWTSSTDWHFRAAVASAAGDTLDREFAISRAAPLTRDADPRVREAAFAALAPTPSMPLEDSVHALLVNALRDPDFYVRATVIGALADRPSAADLAPVLASYSQATRDSANDARLAAIQYVAALWKRDSSALKATWLAQLQRIPMPLDPLERAAGKAVPVWSTWGNARTTSRPLAWYEGIVRAMVMPAYAGKSLTATINTIRGPIRLELFGAEAPMTVWNFLTLARSGYYRNTRFHRVVPNFVAQDGDPRDDGNGGPGYAIRDEMNRHRYERGAVGMALSGPDTGGSQYFITHSPQPHLDGHYTVFGQVISGYDVLDKLVQGDLITRINPK
jgi:cyclophilin family peptidyl-prolyl cis-trans isomerase/HEAT repeat protein